MSSVPKSRRKPHDFQTPTKLHKIRELITELAVNDFGYDKERLEEKIKRFEQSMTNIEPERKAAIVAKMRWKNESFFTKFVEKETDTLLDLARWAVFEFEMGNSIFPTGLSRVAEFRERRKHLDAAIGWLHCMKQELQYIAETLPGDKNRYVPLSDEIEVLIDMVKGVRRSANRFLKKDSVQTKQNRKTDD